MGLFGNSEKKILKEYGMSSEKVIAWQNLVTNTVSNSIKVSKAQLLRASKMIVENHLCIIDDCVHLVNTTLEPEVFFKRFELLIAHCQEVNKYEPFYPFLPPLPSEQYAIIIKNRPATEKLFIDRMYRNAINSAQKLKTEAGRKNKINKFYEKLKPYESRMLPETINYIHTLKL